MRLLSLLLLAPSVACIPYTPPAAPKPRTATVVPAPMDSTWNAVIDVFAQQVITIETMERASGFIVASREGMPTRSRADSAAGKLVADCGRGAASAMQNMSAAFLPTSAKYNVLVRPAGRDSSTVQVTVKFMSVSPSRVIECSSTGKFESAFEDLVRLRVEKK